MIDMTVYDSVVARLPTSRIVSGNLPSPNATVFSAPCEPCGVTCKPVSDRLRSQAGQSP